MNYFKDVTSVQDLKAMYHELCFKHHPDVTQEDTNWIMQVIKNISSCSGSDFFSEESL